MPMYDNGNKEIKVELTEEFLKKILYWIICKYKMDEYTREQSSAKRALLGGFIDRWMNKAPEFLIFDELLKDKDFSVIMDTFFYNKGESKNAPDILGLIDEKDKYYPFAKFIDNHWEVGEDVPFVEMKTFRSDQSLVTIPLNQFDENHYYAIVESHLNENYLLSIFDDDLFDNNDYYNYITNLKEEEFVISNKEGIISKPEKLQKSDKLGYYNLLGIYKGSDLKKLSRLVEKGDNPIYFYENTNSPSRFQKRFQVVPPIRLDSGLHNFDDDDKNIPFDIEISENSELKIEYQTKKALDVSVIGDIKIDGVKLDSGMRRLSFRNFEKTGTIKEIVLTKSLLKHYSNRISSTNELISKFQDIIDKN